MRPKRAAPPPDYNDPFGPKQGSNRRLIRLHCNSQCNEQDVVWDNRGGDWLWYCPKLTCHGAGIDHDLFDVESEMGKGLLSGIH